MDSTSLLRDTLYGEGVFYPPLISFIKGRNTAAGSLFSDAERERAVALDGHLLKVRGFVACVYAHLNALDAYILFFPPHFFFCVDV